MVRFRARRGLAGRRCDPDFMGKAEGLPDRLKASELGPKAETGMLSETVRFSNRQGEVGSMLDQEDELHLLGFLATLAGLLGIVVGVSQFQVGSASSATVRAYFSLLLVVFLFAAALAYLGALQDRDVASFNLAVLGYFSALLGFAVGLAAASLLPVDVQFGGFWVIAIIAALSFSTGHCNAGTVSSIGARVLVRRLWGGWVRSTGD